MLLQEEINALLVYQREELSRLGFEPSSDTLEEAVVELEMLAGDPEAGPHRHALLVLLGRLRAVSSEEGQS